MNNRSNLPETGVITARKSLLKLLVAEDNPFIVRYLKTILRRNLMPCEADFVSKHVEVFKALELSRYNLLLLDDSLPEMRGESIVEQIRINGNDTPIILLALSETKLTHEQIIGLGIEGIAYKPLVLEELITEIKRVLEISTDDRGTQSKFYRVVPETVRVRSGIIDDQRNDSSKDAYTDWP